MARSIDQVPQHQDNNPEEPSVEQSPAQKPLRYINTDLASAVETHHKDKESGALIVPDYVHEDVVADPDAAGAIEEAPVLPDKKRAKKFSLARRGIAVTGIAAGIAGAIYGISSSNEDFDAADRAEAGTSAVENGQSTVLTLSPEMAGAQSRFDSQRDAIDGSIRQGLTDLGWGYANYYPDGSGPSSKDMSPAEITNRNLAETQWVLENPNEAQALEDVSLLALPGTRPHASITKQVHNTTPESNKSVDIIMPIGTPYRFSEGSHDGIDSNGRDTWLIANTSLTDSSRGVAVFQWAENPNGGGEWQLADNDSPEVNPNFDQTYADLLKK